MGKMAGLQEMIKRHEGLSLTPYRCSSGKLTIGWGRNLEDRGINESEAEMLLHNDIMLAQQYLGEVFPWMHKVNGPRYDALVDMVFNLGKRGFLSFKKMRFYLNAARKLEEEGNKDGADKAWKLAAKEIVNSMYASQVGDRAREIAYMVANNKYRGEG